MLKFPSIDSFRHAVANIKRAYDYKQLPYPVLNFNGYVKLHGTNAGIYFNFETGEVRAQSRERVLSVDSDNAGFARWVADNSNQLYYLFHRMFSDHTGDDPGITIYGEWIGPGIQKNVALNQLPEKQFVVFAVGYHDTIVDNDDGSTSACFYSIGDVENGHGIPGLRWIAEAPIAKIEIDFRSPDLVIETLEELTQKYEDECPWGKINGISGIGEGLVWMPEFCSSFKLEPIIPYQEQRRTWFKTKGEKHGNKGTNNKVKVAVTAEKIEEFDALIAEILPDWRLEQGFSKLKETHGVDPTREHTGEFLKWIVSDAHKEQLDTVEASEFEWKVVAGELSKRARQWFLSRT